MLSSQSWVLTAHVMRQAKWGPGGGGENACAIEVQDPISGNASLPQKPFSSLLYLQRHWYEEDPHFRNVPILAGLGKSAKREQPEWAKQALAEADLAAEERTQASGDAGVSEASSAAKAAAGAVSVAGAATAVERAAASDPGGGAVGKVSKEGLAFAELDAPKTAGEAGEASDVSEGIDAAVAAAAADGEEEEAAAGDVDGFDALDEDGLDTYPDEADEDTTFLAELDGLEAASGDGEEILGDLESFETAGGDEEALADLADLETVEAKQGAIEQENLHRDADAELDLSNPARERLPLSYSTRLIPACHSTPRVRHVEVGRTCTSP